MVRLVEFPTDGGDVVHINPIKVHAVFPAGAGTRIWTGLGGEDYWELTMALPDVLAALREPPKVVQIAALAGGDEVHPCLYALLSDGTIWQRTVTSGGWYRSGEPSARVSA